MVCLYPLIIFKQNLVDNNNESLSKTITGEKVERLKEMFADNAQSTNGHNKRTVVPRQGESILLLLEIIFSFK